MCNCRLRERNSCDFCFQISGRNVCLLGQVRLLDRDTSLLQVINWLDHCKGTGFPPRRPLLHRYSVIWQYERQSCRMVPHLPLGQGERQFRGSFILFKSNLLRKYTHTARYCMGMLRKNVLFQLYSMLPLTSHSYSKNYYGFSDPLCSIMKLETRATEVASCFHFMILPQ